MASRPFTYRTTWQAGPAGDCWAGAGRAPSWLQLSGWLDSIWPTGATASRCEAVQASVWSLAADPTELRHPPHTHTYTLTPPWPVQVEYMLIPVQGGGWRIASALVLGK